MSRTLVVLLLLVLVGVVEARAQDLVLTNANVIDVTDGSVTSGATVTVRAGRIVSIDAAGSPAPAGVRVVDLAGRYLAPGLMDAHVHVGSARDARRALESVELGDLIYQCLLSGRCIWRRA